MSVDRRKVKKLRLRATDFLEGRREEIEGKRVQVEGDTHVIEGRATKVESSPMFGTDVGTMEVKSGKHEAYAKMSYQDDVYETRLDRLQRIREDADAIATLATAGVELEGKTQFLQRENGTRMLARLTMQRKTRQWKIQRGSCAWLR